MKKHHYIMPVAGMLVTAALLLVTGCGDSGHHHDGDLDANHHEHSEAGHGHSEGGHMQHMEEVRDWLKSELKEQYDQPVPPADEATVASGREVYISACSTCHGMTGKGDGPSSAGPVQKPADFTDPAHSTYYSDQGRIYIIKNGVEGTPMTGWKGILSEEEIQAVYAYVRSLRNSGNAADAEGAIGAYVCPMHPRITSDEPGQCSICGMNLVLMEDGHDEASHIH